MAKVLTEQPSLPGATATDVRQFGDGAPLHSAEAFDAARTLNNMTTFREPSMQFLHDASLLVPTETVYGPRIRYRIKAVGAGDGTCMLGQAPIFVPVDATRLRWSLGIYRDPAGGLDPVPVEVNVNTITMYLCSEPVRDLTDPVPATIVPDNETCRRFYEGSLTGPWTSNTVSAGATAGGGGLPMYTKVRSSTWTDFAPRGTNNINDRTGDPWAYLIVTAGFSAGVTGEQIRGAELCIWFEYDDAPFLLDDAGRGPARNGKPALAQVYRRIIETANKFSCRPRPIGGWWGGNNVNTTNEADTESSVRRIWTTGEKGAPRLKVQVLAVPIADMLAAPSTGLQIFTEDHDQSFLDLVPQTPGRREDLNDATTDYYPRYATPVSLFGTHVADYSSPATTRQVRVHIGNTNPGPQLRSGLIIERRIKDPVSGIEALPLDPYTMGAEILGVGPTYRDLRAMRDFINRLARQKMMHFGWGIEKNSLTGVYGHNVTLGVGGTDRRYILSPTYGEGGIAPTVDGPGIEIPVRYTSLGKGTTVRAYIRVYARMSGGGGTGLLGYYNRNNSGGMAGPFNITHTPTIGGTTWQWYPNTTTINEATDPWVDLNANPANDCDNLVLLGGRGSGSDDLLIGAWSICVRASEAF